jgi:hypothetical protein
MTTAELVRLKEATNAAIAEVYMGLRLLHSNREAINWGDLSCRSARWVMTDEEPEYAEVLIEEADPECPEFQAAVAAKLEKAGFPHVRVVTEW